MIYSLIFAHWIADFVFQSDYMAKNKSKSWKALSMHIAAYTFFLYAIMFPFAASYEAGISYALINGAAHFIVDANTSRITSKLYAEGDIHNFFVVIGLDQAIHMATLIGTAYMLSA